MDRVCHFKAKLALAGAQKVTISICHFQFKYLGSSKWGYFWWHKSGFMPININQKGEVEGLNQANTRKSVSRVFINPFQNICCEIWFYFKTLILEWIDQYFVMIFSSFMNFGCFPKIYTGILPLSSLASFFIFHGQIHDSNKISYCLYTKVLAPNAR